MSASGREDGISVWKCVSHAESGCRHGQALAPKAKVDVNLLFFCLAIQSYNHSHHWPFSLRRTCLDSLHTIHWTRGSCTQEWSSRQSPSLDHLHHDINRHPTGIRFRMLFPTARSIEFLITTTATSTYPIPLNPHHHNGRTSSLQGQLEQLPLDPKLPLMT